MDYTTFLNILAEKLNSNGSMSVGAVHEFFRKMGIDPPIIKSNLKMLESISKIRIDNWVVSLGPTYRPERDIPQDKTLNGLQKFTG